jgi:hypothetical protein
MDNTMNIVDYKHELEKLTGNILNEYMILESTYLQEKKNSVLNLTDINSKNTSICKDLQEKTNKIYSLEQGIVNYKLKEVELHNIIDNLRNDLKNKNDNSDNNETNKFDMIRSQAKEITCKDREIERLTKEISTLKEMNETKGKLSMVVKDDISGWSPTSSKEPKIEVIELKLEENETNDGGNSLDNQVEELFIISYRKKKYYRNSENKVFEINEGDEGEEVGECIGDWVKKDNGKFKLNKY